MTELLSFTEAMSHVPTGKKPHVLLGNGFSRACRDDIFAYGALFDRADFTSLSASAKSAFDVLGTTDFEAVMRSLRSAAELTELYEPTMVGAANRMRVDAEALKEVLVKAIADSHPDRPSDVSDESYAACRAFLSTFERIYTVNYDLLLYWALMHDALPPKLACDDGFRTPQDGPQEYVTWEADQTYKQNVYYLHGALHIFDAGIEIQKYTWKNTGIRLIDQVRSALQSKRFPLFVAEGSSAMKLARIRHSDFLSKARRSFGEIGGSLVIYGHSLAPSDEHILNQIERGKLKQVLVGVHGDPESPSGQHVIARAHALAATRSEKHPLEVLFFRTESVKVWK